MLDFSVLSAFALLTSSSVVRYIFARDFPELCRESLPDALVNTVDTRLAILS